MIVNVTEKELVKKEAIVMEKLYLTAKCFIKSSLKTLKNGIKVIAK